MNKKRITMGNSGYTGLALLLSLASSWVTAMQTSCYHVPEKFSNLTILEGSAQQIPAEVPADIPNDRTPHCFTHETLEKLLCDLDLTIDATTVVPFNNGLQLCKLYKGPRHFMSLLLPSNGPYILMKEEDFIDKNYSLQTFVNQILHSKHLFGMVLDLYKKTLIHSKNSSEVLLNLYNEILRHRSKVKTNEEIHASIQKSMLEHGLNPTVLNNLIMINQLLITEHKKLINLELTWRLSKITNLSREIDALNNHQIKDFEKPESDNAPNP